MRHDAEILKLAFVPLARASLELSTLWICAPTRLVSDKQAFRYMLYPELNGDDEYHLMTNGSVFAPLHLPNLLMPGVDYCMENIPELGLRVFVCFFEGEYEKNSTVSFVKSPIPAF